MLRRIIILLRVCITMKFRALNFDYTAEAKLRLEQRGAIQPRPTILLCSASKRLECKKKRQERLSAACQQQRRDDETRVRDNQENESRMTASEVSLYRETTRRMRRTYTNNSHSTVVLYCFSLLSPASSVKPYNQQDG